MPRAGTEEEDLARAESESLLLTKVDNLVFFPGDGLFGERGRRVMELVASVFAASGPTVVVVAVTIDVEGVVVVVVVVVAILSLAARFFRVFLGVPATGKTICNAVVRGGGLLGS